MNVELTIQDLFDNYPCLFKERADALSHLFCTIGNGYEWKEGELVINVPIGSSPTLLESHLVEGKAFQHNKLSLRAESQLYEQERIAQGWYDAWKNRWPEDDVEKMKAIRQKTIAKLPDDVYYREPERKKRWGFFVNIPNRQYVDFHENFSFLFNYPDDIKPDWKDAIEECRGLLVEDGFELPHRQRVIL